MVNAGIEPTITKNGLVIDGFYKSGTILLTHDEENFIVKARYNEETTITSFDDLVYLNYGWWQRSKDRSDWWKQPNLTWADEMVRLGLVTKKVIPETVVYE
jgi:hypothetical protein